MLCFGTVKRDLGVSIVPGIKPLWGGRRESNPYRLVHSQTCSSRYTTATAKRSEVGPTGRIRTRIRPLRTRLPIRSATVGRYVLDGAKALVLPRSRDSVSKRPFL